MTNNEKCELHKETIHKLYSREGKSKVYISQLLNIHRGHVANKIKEWGFEEAPPQRRAKPSTEDFLNRNKQFIISKLEADVSITDIARELKVSRKKIITLSQYDEDIRLAHENYLNKIKTTAQNRKEKMINKSSRVYDWEPIEGEVWKIIPGYEDYEISNYARIRHFVSKYQSYYLLRPTRNKKHDRYYFSIKDANRKKHTIIRARLVALAFCDGHSTEKDTVNHIDGNIHNDNAENLEWTSQSENNKHAYDKLNRPINIGKPISYYIVYQDKQFKTISSFARFIGKSETQARRWIENKEKHGIALIPKDNN